jgi:ABC-2 type transport system permease protein
VWTPLVVGGIFSALLAAWLWDILQTILMNGMPMTTKFEGQTTLTVEQFIKVFTGGMIRKTSAPILLTTYCVSLFYLAGTMYTERKNRSVLFWKSLPISDTATVLSKAAMALIVAPTLAAIIALCFGFLLLMLCAVASPFSSQVNLSSLSNIAGYLEYQLLILGSIPVYVLWALPTVGAILLISAWARNTPLFWVVVVPLLLGVCLSWLKNHSLRFTDNLDWYWQGIVGRGLLTNVSTTWSALNPSNSPDPLTSPLDREIVRDLSEYWHLLTTANLWIGVAAGSAMIYAAIRIRRWKDEG